MLQLEPGRPPAVEELCWEDRRHPAAADDECLRRRHNTSSSAVLQLRTAMLLPGVMDMCNTAELWREIEPWLVREPKGG